MGEGAAVLVLEERSRALARGAPIYAEVCGYGLTNDAHHMTAPRPDGRQAARAMRLALADARVAPARSATSTPTARPRRSTTRPRPRPSSRSSATTRAPLAVSGTKGYYGHALGASGAIEAAICALASAARLAPADGQPRRLPTRPATSTISPAKAAMADPSIILSNSFGFGGINAAWCSAVRPLERRVDPPFTFAALRRPVHSDSSQELDGCHFTRRSASPNPSAPSALVFIGCGARLPLQDYPGGDFGMLGIALAHALALAVMITATMDISGGHLNPAVTLGLLAVRRIDAADRRRLHRRPAGRRASLGAAAASRLLSRRGVTASDRARHSRPSRQHHDLGTGDRASRRADLLPGVARSSAPRSSPDAPKVGGFGVGLVLLFDILVGGPLTGAAMNPARAFGPALVSGQLVGAGRVWWIGPILGGVVAALLWEQVLLPKA